MLNNRLIVLNGATGSISNIKRIYITFISLLIPLKFGLTMIIIILCHTICPTANNYTADAKDFKISSTHFIETINYNNLNGIFKLYPIHSLQRIISKLSITNTEVLVTVTPAICQLEDTTSFAQAACLSPGNSTSSTTDTTSKPSEHGITSTSTTSSSRILSSLHTPSISTSTTTNKMETTISSISSTTRPTNTQTTGIIASLSTSRVSTTSLTSSTAQSTTSTQTTGIIASSNATTLPSSNGSNPLLDVTIISITISLVLVGVLVGMVTVGCYCYILNYKRNSLLEGTPGNNITMINNISLQYSVPPLDDDGGDGVETEMIISANDSVTDDEKHCLLSD